MMINNNDQAKIIQGFPAGRLHPLRCVLRVPQLGRDEDLLPGHGDGDGGDHHDRGDGHHDRGNLLPDQNLKTTIYPFLPYGK